MADKSLFTITEAASYPGVSPDVWKSPSERLNAILSGQHDYITNSEAYPLVYGLCRRLGLNAEATAQLAADSPLAEHHEMGQNVLGDTIQVRQRDRD